MKTPHIPQDPFAKHQSSPRLRLAEQAFAATMQELTGPLIHGSDRPRMETRILTFLDHATGPDTAGIARELGLSPMVIKAHLHSLASANRVWSQSVKRKQEWRISGEGRRFLERCHP